jgi:hypothetical protein
MVRNGAILSVDCLCNINNFECSISGMFFSARSQTNFSGIM